MNEVIEKARRLLQLRERAATPGEAQAAARALAKMLDKHRISVAELEASGMGPGDQMSADDGRPILSYRRIPIWKKRLLETLCRHYGVACWRDAKPVDTDRRGRLIYTYNLKLCGRRSDVDILRYMFAWLSAETERLSRQECHGQGSVSHNSWRRGFVNGIKNQLEMARDAVYDENGQAALVLRKRYSDALEFLRRTINLEKARKSYHYIQKDDAAHDAGKKMGESQHLGDRLDSGVHRALPAAAAS